MTRDEAVKYFDEGLKRGIPEEELKIEAKKRMAPLGEYGPGGKLYAGGTGNAPDGYNIADIQSGTATPRQVAGMVSRAISVPVGAMVGGMAGRVLGRAIPAIAGPGFLSAAGRVALSAGGEGAGAATGSAITGTIEGRSPEDILKSAAITGGVQTGLSTAQSVGTYAAGWAGGVKPNAASSAMGRPDFVRKLPQSSEMDLALEFNTTAANLPLSEGRKTIEKMIVDHDISRKFIDGDRLIKAAEDAMPRGQSAEAVSARNLMKRDIARLRSEISMVASGNKNQSRSMPGAPSVNIPGRNISAPEVTVGGNAGRPMLEDPYGLSSPSVNVPGGQSVSGVGTVMSQDGFTVPGRNPGLLPSESTTLPAISRDIPAVSIQKTDPQLIPRWAPENSYVVSGGKYQTAHGEQYLSRPLTAAQADSIIQKSMTSAVKKELEGKVGGTIYKTARAEARNRAAQEMYYSLGPGASEAGGAAHEALLSRESVRKTFPIDEQGIPKPSAAAAVAQSGSETNTSGPILLKRLQGMDNDWGTKLVAKARELGFKRNWGTNDEQAAAIIADTLNIPRGRTSIGAVRSAIKAIARAGVRAQGKTGAVARGYATQAFESAMRTNP